MALLNIAVPAAADTPAAPSEFVDYTASEPDSARVTEKIIVSRYLSDGSLITDTVAADDYSRFEIKFLETVAADRLIEPEAPPRPKKMSNVMFGIELGTGLDLSSTDMSTFNADIVVGYRHKLIQFLGVSVGLHKSLGTRDSFLPIQAVFRTGFRKTPTLFFMQASVGYSFNTISSSPMFGDTMATVGAGLNLVQRPKFQSNLILSFGFRHFTERHQEMAQINKPNIGFAQISFGISI